MHGASADVSADAPPASVVAALRARTATRFALADFLKPRMDGASPIDPYLAPLIQFEAPHDAPLGSAFLDAEGRLAVDAGRPTVYYTDRRVELQGREHRQLAFVWFRDAHPPRAQGVRLTFDADGFPAIFEVFADDSGARLAYVTEGLERAAAEAFGGALPGRAFAVEAAHTQAQALAIVGSVSSSPAALGPYVYQARGTNDIATLHCRCSPTQVDAIRAALEYELLPFDALAGAWPLPGQAGWPPADAPARGLRLPPAF